MKNIGRLLIIILLSIPLILTFSCSKNLEDIEAQNVDPCTGIDTKSAVENSILVDASRDGGVWWFPQSIETGFSQEEEHQGQLFADYLRTQGYQVDELPRGTKITADLLCKYNKVIRAGKHGQYTADELNVYESFLNRGSSLILISEFVHQNSRDMLAERLGIRFIGMAKAIVSEFAQHPLTQDIKPFYYNAGSVILDKDINENIEVLGWIPGDTEIKYLYSNVKEQADKQNNYAVMGILHHPKSKIFFIGDINGLECMPQPLIDNLLHWTFE